MRETFRIDPDASPMDAVVEADADPDRWLGVAETLAEGGDPEVPPEAAGEQDGEETPLQEGVAIGSGEELHPNGLLMRDWWVNWVRALPFRDGAVDEEATPTKQPVAPYDTGHARPVRWHSGLDEEDHPATEYDVVQRWEGLRLGTDIETADRVVSSTIGSGVIIPVGAHEEAQPITLLDWDDVRDPESGTIHPVCAEALRRGGYAEISQSGEGIHQFLYGSIPGGLAKFLRHIDDEPFVGEERPMLEMYASGRLTAMTGQHVAGTARDLVEGQDLIDDLCWQFGTADNNSPGTPTDPFGRTSEDATAGERETPSHEAVGEALREAAAYDGADPDGWEIPEAWSTRYAAVIRGRERAADGGLTGIANWELNGYAGALGYHDGRDLEDVIADLDAVCDDSGVEREARQAYRKAAAGNYEAPAAATLASRGLLPESYAEPRGWTPQYDVINEETGEQATAAAGASQTDGGVEAASAATAPGPDDPRSAFERLEDDVHSAIAAVSGDNEMTKRTARHRIAEAFVTHYDFVHPEEDVRGWRNVLYIYDQEAGVYEPRGQAFIEQLLERTAGDFVSNQVTNEIIGKVRRMTTARGDQFERDPERIVVENGILNLHTGELTEHTPAEYHRQRLDVAWRPGAGEPAAIDEFLHEIVDDSDVITLYRLIAHTLYKSCIAEKAAILIGSGQNGKSVFIDLIEQFLGPWNVSHRELQDFNDDNFAANNLEGKLANLATEIGEQELADTTTFKKLTGQDTIDAPVKFEKPVRFENYATMMFATNNMPVFGQDNHAIWRRWVFVNFPYTFSADDPEAKDPEPRSQLLGRITAEAELEALLVRCQQEIERWHQDPQEQFFADSMGPDEVRDRMKKAAEPVYNFATTCLDPGDDVFVEKSVARAAYRAYADEEDLPTVPENEFGKRLVGLRDFAIEATQRRVDGSRPWVYSGVELSARGRQVLGVDEPEDNDQEQIDDAPQATRVVLEQLREMVEENDGEPVPRDGIEWACAGDVGKTTAANALDELKTRGEVFVSDDGVLPTS